MTKHMTGDSEVERDLRESEHSLKGSGVFLDMKGRDAIEPMRNAATTSSCNRWHSVPCPKPTGRSVTAVRKTRRLFRL